MLTVGLGDTFAVPLVVPRALPAGKVLLLAVGPADPGREAERELVRGHSRVGACAVRLVRVARATHAANAVARAVAETGAEDKEQWIKSNKDLPVPVLAGAPVARL